MHSYFREQVDVCICMHLREALRCLATTVNGCDHVCGGREVRWGLYECKTESYGIQVC